MWGYEMLIPGGEISNDTESTYVFLPSMLSGSSCADVGVHWRLEKQTPLFKGEDFFIVFNKRALSTDIPSGIKNNSSTNIFKQPYSLYNNSNYSALDPLNVKTTTVAGDSNPSAQYPVNSAVVKYSVSKNNTLIPTNQNVYDLRDQAYYIVELGIGTQDDHYFIIITQRGDPIFVRTTGGISY
jgi:hypothetical protein